MGVVVDRRYTSVPVKFEGDGKYSFARPAQDITPSTACPSPASASGWAGFPESPAASPHRSTSQRFSRSCTASPTGGSLSFASSPTTVFAPFPASPSKEPDRAVAAASHLEVGTLVRFRGLARTNRADLEGVLARTESWKPDTERWECRIVQGSSTGKSYQLALKYLVVERGIRVSGPPSSPGSADPSSPTPAAAAAAARSRQPELGAHASNQGPRSLPSATDPGSPSSVSFASLPPGAVSKSRQLELGAYVCIQAAGGGSYPRPCAAKGLRGATGLNGKCGTVVGSGGGGAAAEYWEVHIDGGQELAKCRAENLFNLGLSPEVEAKPESVGIARQYRVAPSSKVTVYGSPDMHSHPYVFQEAGAVVFTTGRTHDGPEGRWIEIKWPPLPPPAANGWMLSKTSSGVEALQADLSRGRHGDHLESRGGVELAIQFHKTSMLLMKGIGNQETDLQDVAGAEAPRLKYIVARAGLADEDCAGLEDLRHRAYEAVCRPPPVEPGMLQIKQGPHSAHLWTPAGAAPDRPLPLLVVLHGAGKRSDRVPGGWDFRKYIHRFDNGEFTKLPGPPATANHDRGDAVMESVATKFGILVLLVEAVDHTWDFITTGQRRDVDFIQSTLSDVRMRRPVDESRIAIMGMSDGGSMALSLALCNPHIFQAVLAQAAGFYHSVGTAAGQEKPHILLEYGKLEEIFPFETVACKYRDELQKAGYQVMFRAVEGIGHRCRPGFTADAIKYWLRLPPRQAAAAAAAGGAGAERSAEWARPN